MIADDHSAAHSNANVIEVTATAAQTLSPPWSERQASAVHQSASSLSQQDVHHGIHRVHVVDCQNQFLEL